MDIGNAITSISILFAVMMAYMLLRQFMHRQERQQEYTLEIQREQMRMQRELDEKKMEREEMRFYHEREEQEVTRDPGGYIIVDLPDEQRSAFVDLLKGFEEYAQLRGYSVLFSVDSSIQHKIAFKFTVGVGGLNVSRAQVQKDFEDYIKVVQKGDDLVDLPVVLSAEQHDLLLTTLRNRINFMNHSHRLTNNTIRYYERLLDRGAVVRGMFESAPSVVVQTGGTIDSRSFSSTNSPQAIQGDGNKDIYLEADNSVRIENSFNKRNNQIDAIASLIEAIRSTSPEPTTLADDAIRNLNNIQEELREEETPDRSRVHRWLTRTKEALKSLSLTKDVTDAMKRVYEAFDVTDLIQGLF